VRGPRVAHPRVDIGNSLLVVVIRWSLSTCPKGAESRGRIEGVSLKTMNGGSVSTHGQKNVFEVTHFDRLRPSARRAGQSAATPRVICKNPLPRSSARTSCWPSRQSRTATTRALCEDHHEGRDLLGAPYERSILPPSQERVRHRPTLLAGPQRTVLYDVNCEMSKEACETHPSTLCAVLPSAATAS
jgi:hypothetical protein